MLDYSDFILITFRQLLEVRCHIQTLCDLLGKFDSGAVMKSMYPYSKISEQAQISRTAIQQAIICIEDLKEVLMDDCFDGLANREKKIKMELSEELERFQILAERNIDSVREELVVCRGYLNDPLIFRILHSAFFNS